MPASASRHLVDPELLALLDAWPQIALSDEVLAAARGPSRLAPPLPPPPVEHHDRVEMQVRSVPGPAGAPPVPLTLYRPLDRTGAVPCIYYIHGGGFIIGSAAMVEPVHRRLAHALGCLIVAVDYRLAPETPHPGPVEDCYAGLAWLFDHAAALGVDRTRIGVMGESAGGGLAAGLALLARDRGEYRLAFQHLVYPMLDDRTCVALDPHPYAGEFVWTPHSNAFGWRAYLGTEPGSDGISPYAAPARAADLSGLPPTFVSCGALDLFVEEDIDYARRLIRAGVPTELHIYPGGYHGFDGAPGARVSAQAARDIRAALGRFLG